MDSFARLSGGERFDEWRRIRGGRADVVVGEGQPLGIPLSFGGPYVGLFTTKNEYVRKMAGRLVGETVDSRGQRGFVLPLTPREQHIRRERATSNICTNQALCALAACVYLASVGKTGLHRIAELNLENASYLRSELKSVKGIEVLTEGPIFNEFVIRFQKSSAGEVNRRLLEKGIIGGLDLGGDYPECKNQMLLCATETKRRSELDRLITAFKEILK